MNRLYDVNGNQISKSAETPTPLPDGTKYVRGGGLIARLEADDAGAGEYGFRMERYSGDKLDALIFEAKMELMIKKGKEGHEFSIWQWDIVSP